MQLQMFILAMVMALSMRQAGVEPLPADSPYVRSPGGMLLALNAARLLLLVLLMMAHRPAYRWARSRRSVEHAQAPRGSKLVAWAGDLYRVSILAFFILDILLGHLEWLRSLLGDLVLLDEILAMAPTLAFLAAPWWLRYPLERSTLEEDRAQRLASGGRPPAVLTLGQHMLSQFRHQMALTLAPVLCIMAWHEIASAAIPVYALPLGLELRGMLTFAGAVGVFLTSPWLLTHVWDTVPLPDGPLRDRLMAMCRTHKVGVAELLLWRTFGGLINAAVLGAVRPFRYILLTDALIERMPDEAIEAVMAHELAHVKRRHMFWLMLSAVTLFTACLTGASVLVQWVVQAEWMKVLAGWLPKDATDLLRETSSADWLGAGLGIAAWCVPFFWISRQFERQADTFAVQHLRWSLASTDERLAATAEVKRRNEPELLIDERSAHVMIDALDKVAELNHIPRAQRSLRHGSIASRQAHLRSLVGQPLAALPIDRHVKWIKAAMAALALGLIVAMIAA